MPPDPFRWPWAKAHSIPMVTVLPHQRAQPPLLLSLLHPCWGGGGALTPTFIDSCPPCDIMCIKPRSHDNMKNGSNNKKILRPSTEYSLVPRPRRTRKKGVVPIARMGGGRKSVQWLAAPQVFLGSWRMHMQ